MTMSEQMHYVVTEAGRFHGPYSKEVAQEFAQDDANVEGVAYVLTVSEVVMAEQATHSPSHDRHQR